MFKKLIEVFSPKKICNTIDDLGGRVYLVMIFACVALWYGKLPPLYWTWAAGIFAFYRIITRYIVPILKIAGAIEGIKDLDVPEDGKTVV